MSESSDNEVEFLRKGGEEGQGDVVEERVEVVDEEHSDAEVASPEVVRQRRPLLRPRPEPLDMNDRRFRQVPTHQDSRAPPSSLHVKPEPFDGSEEWELYFSHFQSCARLGRWDDEVRALTLATCLRGPARSFFLTLSLADRLSYRHLVQKLCDRFGSARQQSRYLAKFEARERHPDESIASLGDDLRLIAQRAYPELTPDAQESLALHQLYKSLSPEMKCRCIDRDCSTVEGAVAVVERYEAILGEQSDKKNRRIRAVDVPKIQTSDESHNGQANGRRSDPPYQQQRKWSGNGNNIESILQQISRRLDKLEASSTSKQGRSRLCYICDSPNHFFRNCPKNTERSSIHREEKIQGNSKPLTH